MTCEVQVKICTQSVLVWEAGFCPKFWIVNPVFCRQLLNSNSAILSTCTSRLPLYNALICLPCHWGQFTNFSIFFFFFVQKRYNMELCCTKSPKCFSLSIKPVLASKACSHCSHFELKQGLHWVRLSAETTRQWAHFEYHPSALCK